MFNAEYPMVRLLEANGYDVSYTTGVDSDRSGAELLEHDALLSVGHDEYWSGAQRANVEAARDARRQPRLLQRQRGVLEDALGERMRRPATWSSTRRPTPTPESIRPATWTGTWRDPRSINAEGARPENGLTGHDLHRQLRHRDLQVPADDGKLRLLARTPVASSARAARDARPRRTLGYEWDEDLDNGVAARRPDPPVDHGRDGVQVIQDYGSTYGSGTATHHLTLYRDTNGAEPRDALVFGAGTIQWTWGLDADHDRSGSPTDPSMRQATVNLFADMGVQPRTLQAGLSRGERRRPTLAPPSAAITVAGGGRDGRARHARSRSAARRPTRGGKVGGVEVSMDGGTTWHPADGRGTLELHLDAAALAAP